MEKSTRSSFLPPGLISLAILSYCLITLSFIAQQLHLDARYIERFNVLASHIVALDRSNLLPILLFQQLYTIQIKLYFTDCSFR
jgi:hypothetical protein